MRRRTLFIGGGVAALALALSFVGLKVSHHSAWAHGARHDGHHMAGGMAHFCTSDKGAHFDKLTGYLKSKLDLSDAQDAAWNELTAVWRENEIVMRASCDAIENDSAAQGAGGLLARAEIQMGAGLTAVRSMRPAYETFYATLNAEQRDTLERFGHR